MRRLRLPLLPLLLLILAGCGGSSPSPPVAPSPAPPAAPLPIVFSGRATSTVTGDPLGGIAIDLGGTRSTTDAAGGFRYEWPRGSRPSTLLLTMSADGIVPRGLWLSAFESREVAVDAITLDGGFHPEYYRRFVRNALESPDGVRTLRRWMQAPMIYVRTVDEAGEPIDAMTLESVIAALADDAEAWTGGQFGIASLVTGPETRQGQVGWVTVKWPNPYEAGVCGRAQVATQGGWIELNHLNPNCGCGNSRIAPGLARHELGHTMGFYHTEEPGDLMVASLPFNLLCNGRASNRERRHAAIAYRRPNGNFDPDTDPSSVIHRSPGPPVIVVD